MHVSGRTEEVWNKTKGKYVNVEHLNQAQIEKLDREGKITAKNVEAHTYKRPEQV